MKRSNQYIKQKAPKKDVWMVQSKWLEVKLWQDTILVWLTLNDWNLYIYVYRLDGMPAIERRKKGAVGFLTRASHKTGSASITQQCFIILGREGPSLIFVFYTGSWQIRYSAFEKYKTAGWDKIHTKRTAAVPGWRRMLLWIRSQISDWTFRFKMWEPDQHKKLTHTHWSTQFFGILFPTDKFVLYFLFHWNIFIKRCNKFLFSA